MGGEDASFRFEEVEKMFGPMIRRIAASHEADRDRAEDLAQDIRVALWRALPGFRGQCALRTFVARIATNRAVSHIKRDARLPRGAELPDDLVTDGPDPEQQAISQDRQMHLMVAVRALPLPLRQAALLALEGLAHPDIAEVLGISPNAVAIRLSRARQALRANLGET
jgi:RNA polymerase sigma-70 factor (ECF subfamily)